MIGEVEQSIVGFRAGSSALADGLFSAGALQNGAPFKDWILPASLDRVRRKLAGVDDGDRQMVDILTTAIRLKGSSISDYVDADGQRGSFQQQHQVYGRAGDPCPICGTPIRRIVVGQRGTHYCPKCQRS